MTRPAPGRGQESDADEGAIVQEDGPWSVDRGVTSGTKPSGAEESDARITSVCELDTFLFERITDLLARGWSRRVVTVFPAHDRDF